MKKITIKMFFSSIIMGGIFISGFLSVDLNAQGLQESPVVKRTMITDNFNEVELRNKMKVV